MLVNKLKLVVLLTIGGGRISSSTNVTFRVDNKPTSILLHNHIDIAEGERVTVVGVQKQNTFVAYAVKNEVTGAIYGHKTSSMIVLFVYLFALLCLGLSFVIIGILPLIGCIAWIKKNNLYSDSMTILENRTA